MEIVIIDFIGRNELCNATLGGEGTTGFKRFKGGSFSAKHRQKLSAALKGRTYSEEYKQKMSNSIKNMHALRRLKTFSPSIKYSDGAKQMWKNPVYRARHSEAMKRLDKPRNIERSAAS